MRSKVDDGIASWPAPPVSPLKLAALTIREFSELSDKRESEVRWANKAEGRARLKRALNKWVKLRCTIAAWRPTSETVAEADFAAASSATNCRARYPRHTICSQESGR